MKKQKLLYFSSRIPENGTPRASDLTSIVKKLSSSFQVNFIVFQSLFLDKITLDSIKRAGAKLVDLKKYDRSKTFDQRMHDFFKEEYSFIMFDSVYTAKYYMPFICLYSPRSKLLMDARHSQYYIENEFSRRTHDKGKKAALTEKSKISCEREIPLYNYFDLLIAANKRHAEILACDVPNIPRIVIEDIDDISHITEIILKLDKYSDKANGYDIAEYYTTIKNRSGRELIRDFSNFLLSGESEYAVIRPKSASYSDQPVEKLMFCMQSHPDIAVVFPVSDAFMARTTSSKVPDPSEEYNFSEFIKKHYIGNFAQWRNLDFLQDYCFLVKREIIKQVGTIDDRFQTLEYALMDLGFKIKHAGYRIVCDQEVFMHYGDLARCGGAELYSDQRLLLDKWGKNTAAVLETL
jgi:hypothetical protein